MKHAVKDKMRPTFAKLHSNSLASVKCECGAVSCEVGPQCPDLCCITAAIAPLSTGARIPLHTSQLTLHTSPFKEV